ncbi:benomyl/methotrexate resistance protein [Penicillium verhagenii]|nr:benomyl/methotrexate resistance protein [Penicillium verhagenii]
MVSDVEQNSLDDKTSDPEANKASAQGTTTTYATEERAASESDPDLVGKNGEDDPEKPVNWTMKKKWTNGGLLAAMILITPLVSSMFVPGVEDVMIESHSTITILASFVVSVYVLGYCIGLLFTAPLSEIYGRVPVYHVSNVFFVHFHYFMC